MSLDFLIEALEIAGDGAFIVNESLTVIYWNQAAEGLLEQLKIRSAGRPCYLILRGMDDRGNLVCHKDCRIARKALQRSPVENFDLNVRSGEGRNQWINISLLSFSNGEDGRLIVHLFRDAGKKWENQRLVDQLTLLAGKRRQMGAARDQSAMSAVQTAKSLTEREMEVLLLLAQGGSTQYIAEALSISANTARNHIQNILKKLGVHSRLEAVVFANRHGLFRRNE